MNKQNQISIGIDFGSHNIRTAGVDTSGNLLTPIYVSEDLAPDDSVKAFELKVVAMLKKVFDDTDQKNIAGIGIGCPSWNGAKQVIGIAPNLPHRLQGLPLGIKLQNWTEEQGFGKLPVFIDNDANSAAVGELLFGGWGELALNMVVLTLGGGIGGGVIITPPEVVMENGKIKLVYHKEKTIVLRGHHLKGAELGHMSIALPQGMKYYSCGCGNLYCLEGQLRVNAVKMRAMDKLKENAGMDRLSTIFDQIRKEHPEAKIMKELIPLVEPRHINNAANDNQDRLALNIEEEVAIAFAQGLRNITQIFDPSLIVIAGEMGKKWPSLTKRAEQIFRSQKGVVPHSDVKIGISKLRNSGILGAAALIFQEWL